MTAGTGQATTWDDLGQMTDEYRECLAEGRAAILSEVGETPERAADLDALESALEAVWIIYMARLLRATDAERYWPFYSGLLAGAPKRA